MSVSITAKALLTPAQQTAWAAATSTSKGMFYRADPINVDTNYGEVYYRRMRRIGRTCSAMMAVDESLKAVDLLTAYFMYEAIGLGYTVGEETPAVKLARSALAYVHTNATIDKQTRNISALLYAVTHDRMRCNPLHHPKGLMDDMIDSKLMNQVYARRIAGTLTAMGISFINDYPQHNVEGMRTANDVQNIEMQEQFVGVNDGDGDNIAFENALHDQIRSFKRGK